MITFGEMRVRGVLIYRTDYQCSSFGRDEHGTFSGRRAAVPCSIAA
jgi:hypothetical protein